MFTVYVMRGKIFSSYLHFLWYGKVSIRPPGIRQTFKLRYTKNPNLPAFAPGPHWGAYSAFKSSAELTRFACKTRYARCTRFAHTVLAPAREPFLLASLNWEANLHWRRHCST